MGVCGKKSGCIRGLDLLVKDMLKLMELSTQTFSPIAKLASVQLFISMVAPYDWPLHQLDINNAFLHGDLHEKVYIEKPFGFVVQGEKRKVCHLRKSLYVL